METSIGPCYLELATSNWMIFEIGFTWHLDVVHQVLQRALSFHSLICQLDVVLDVGKFMCTAQLS